MVRGGRGMMNNLCLCGYRAEIKNYHCDDGKVEYWCLTCNTRVYPSKLEILQLQTTKVRRIIQNWEKN
jgi:hypothetical protein